MNFNQEFEYYKPSFFWDLIDQSSRSSPLSENPFPENLLYEPADSKKVSPNPIWLLIKERKEHCEENLRKFLALAQKHTKQGQFEYILSILRERVSKTRSSSRTKGRYWIVVCEKFLTILF